MAGFTRIAAEINGIDQHREVSLRQKTVQFALRTDDAMAIAGKKRQTVDGVAPS